MPAADVSTTSLDLAEQAARLALTRVTERLQADGDLSDSHLASLAQSVARFRQLYAAIERQAQRAAEEEQDGVPPLPTRLDSRTLQVIKEQVYGIHP